MSMLSGLLEKLPTWSADHANAFVGWFWQPRILATAGGAWVATFTASISAALISGFGSGGVVLGSIAAGVQSILYGAVVPAGSLFSTLTSMGALGTLVPAAATFGAVAGSVVAGAVWVCGMASPAADAA
ncbi:hypothetical protein F4810DRAFT_706004 [Camillea tinctor]|nr:hypothetical protein F4810DRAFT_706004 [Camillea tinctor]